MSDVQNTTTAAETPATDPVTTQQPETTMEETSKPEPISTKVPEPEPKSDEVKPAEPAATKDGIAPIEEKKDEPAAATEKTIEPITEGQLAYKGPGLLKSLIPSKKEFWLSDDAVSPQDLNLYMRGEKPEIAHAIVAWASQTGKGLLFFNKKGDTTRKQPGTVLALYDATDLKKQSPHEIMFKLNGHEHTLKATSDAERDGWFMSLEKSIEMGKASKETTRDSEGYKAEMEKLNKPHVAAMAGAAATKRSQSQPKKSAEVNKADKADKTDDVKRKDSDLEEESKKDKKSRSTSRGVLERLKSKRDEVAAKKEEKKEEKAEEKAEKKEESKPEGEESKVEEAAPAAVASTAAVGTGAAVASSEDNKEESVESTDKSAEKTDEKPKPSKRGSIFGKVQAGWGSMKSPTKEKDQKDAELKPEVPPKDNAVSENPPQIPESTTTTEPSAEAMKTETEPPLDSKKEEVTTPSKENKNFLSSLSFINKRNRSVSPSTNMKEAPAKTETAPAAAKEEPTEPAKVEEPTTETPVTVTSAGAETADKPEEKTEEAAKTEKTETSTTNKRQSVLGSLGRRASKAFKGMQAPKKENAAPNTEAKEETTAVAPAADKPITNGETKPAESTQPQSIGDVVPEAINVGQPQQSNPTVTASA